MPVTVLCTLRRAWGTAGGPVSPGLSLELGTPRILLHGSWLLLSLLCPPAPEHWSPSGTLLSRGRTLRVPWDRGGTPVDQVRLGATPVRCPIAVRPPQWLDVEPVGTHHDVALLGERAGRGTQPSLQATSRAITALSKGPSRSPGSKDPSLQAQEGPTPSWGCTHCLAPTVGPSAHTPSPPVPTAFRP